MISRSRGSTAAPAASSGSLTRAGEFGEGRAQAPSAVGVASQQPVHFESRGEPVRGGPRQSGAVAQFGQPARGLGDGMQYPHGFVEHADAAILSHREILASRMLRCH